MEDLDYVNLRNRWALRIRISRKRRPNSLKTSRISRMWTMATANDVLKIAANEIGYSRWSDPLNGTKYGRWFASYTGNTYYGQNGIPYCAMFVSWVFNQAGQSCPGLPTASCSIIRANNVNTSRHISNKYDAQPGDIVLFNWTTTATMQEPPTMSGSWSSTVGLIFRPSRATRRAHPPAVRAMEASWHEGRATGPWYA